MTCASTQPVTITVTGTNDAPVAVADTDAGHIVEAGNDSNNNVLAGVATTTGNVLANDTDVDLTDTHQVIGVAKGTASGVLTTGVGTTSLGTYGSLVLNDDGTWTYTLDNTNPLTDALAQGAHASDIFSYTESDRHGGTSTTTLTINITGTNDAPVANAAPVAATDVNSGAPVVEQGVNPGNTRVCRRRYRVGQRALQRSRRRYRRHQDGAGRRERHAGRSLDRTRRRPRSPAPMAA